MLMRNIYLQYIGYANNGSCLCCSSYVQVKFRFVLSSCLVLWQVGLPPQSLDLAGQPLHAMPGAVPLICLLCLRRYGGCDEK